jgi:predicted class III extradiol MEMO1 family dioxygenase
MVGHLTESKQKYYASIIEKILDSRTLLLISSDFCHWGDNFDYFFLESKLNTTDKTVSK